MAYPYTSRLWWVPAIAYPFALLVARAIDVPTWICLAGLILWIPLCVKANDSIRP